MSDTVRVMSLLDELEEIIDNASKMPFSEKGLIDVETAQSIVEDMRMAMPKELQEAEWIRQEKDRILDDARSEYSKVIKAAQDQAEYLIENDAIKKEAEKRSAALLQEAENHARYMKLRAYEYVDKMLYDLQTDLAGIASEYLQPMNNYFNQVMSGINVKVNGNRQEMKNLAERIQLSDIQGEEQN